MKHKTLYINTKTHMATWDEDMVTKDHKQFKLAPRGYAQRHPENVVWLVPTCEECIFIDSELPVHKSHPGSCREMMGADCNEDAQPYTSVFRCTIE